MTMSGPVPVLDATAVCWRISSQPTKSTRVSTPVACWNLAVLARKMTSSGSTKRAGRRMRRLAPFSTGSFGDATLAGALVPDRGEHLARHPVRRDLAPRRPADHLGE